MKGKIVNVKKTKSSKKIVLKITMSMTVTKGFILWLIEANPFGSWYLRS